jgi:DNA primase
MGRASAEEVQRLNREVALERLVNGRGVELAKRGQSLVGRCPLCSGGDLEVDPKANRFRCLTCKAKGGVIDWVMAVEGVSKKHAVELLREDVLGEPAGKIVRKATVPKLGGVVADNEDSHAIVRSVIDYYHETLKQSPEAIAYLDKRGLRVIDRPGGFSDSLRHLGREIRHPPSQTEWLAILAT